MCDYSLQGLKSRKARKGDKITTHNFTTGTTGFRDTGDLGAQASATAVCVMPGTEIGFMQAVRIISGVPLGKTVLNGAERVVGQSPKFDTRVATFVQINTDQPMTHHDALEFADGSIVLLTHLLPDQHAKVLELPAPPKTASEAKAQERVAIAG